MMSIPVNVDTRPLPLSATATTVQSEPNRHLSRRLFMTASASTKVTELLIDGELVGAGRGTFTTINPATEEPLGDAADADATDMDRAIAAARVAFDSSDWSRDAALRVHCLHQLRNALNDEIETLREITVAEVGAPVVLTQSAQLQGP